MNDKVLYFFEQPQYFYCISTTKDNYYPNVGVLRRILRSDTQKYKWRFVKLRYDLEAEQLQQVVDKMKELDSKENKNETT